MHTQQHAYTKHYLTNTGLEHTSLINYKNVCTTTYNDALKPTTTHTQTHNKHTTQHKTNTQQTITTRNKHKHTTQQNNNNTQTQITVYPIKAF